MPTQNHNPEALLNKNRLKQHQQSNDAKEWTAIQCDSLIQALQRRINLLRLDAAQYLSPNSTLPEAATETVVQSDADSIQLCHELPAARSKKRVRKTYSSKVKTHTSDSRRRSPPLSQGNVETCFAPATNDDHNEITSAERSQPEDALKSGTFTSDHGPSSFAVRQALRRAKSDMRPQEYQICNGIIHSLEVLLEGTLTMGAHANFRPGSFLNTCLQIVPKHIRPDNGSHDRTTSLPIPCELSGHVEVADISYPDLESLISGGERWPKLAAIVRAHGISVVNEAIEGRLLRTEIGNVLIMLCLRNGCILEAEAILGSLLLSSCISEPTSVHSRPDTASKSTALAVLEEFYRETGRSSYFRFLTMLLSSGKLSIQWLATRYFAPLWPRLLSQMSRNAPGKDVLEMMETVLSLLIQSSVPTQDIQAESIMSVAVSSTLTNLLASLSSISFQNRDWSTSSTTHIMDTAQSCPVEDVILSTIIQEAILCTEGGDEHEPLCISAFAVILLGGYGTSADLTRVELLSLFDKTHRENGDQISQMVCFLTSLVEDFVKSNTNSGLVLFEHLARVIKNYSLPRFPRASHKMQVAIAEAAYMYAAKHGDSEIASIAANFGRSHNPVVRSSTLAADRSEPLAKSRDTGRFRKPLLPNRRGHVLQHRQAERKALGGNTEARFVDLVPSSPESLHDGSSDKENGLASRSPTSSFSSSASKILWQDYMSESFSSTSRKRSSGSLNPLPKRQLFGSGRRKVCITKTYEDDTECNTPPSPSSSSQSTAITASIDSSGDELGY